MPDAMPAQRDTDGGVRAVERALALLAAFTDDDGALPPAEIARRAGLHLSTALRLLATLEAHGFVARQVSGAFALGPQLLVLGERFRRALRLEEVVLPALDRLRAESQESAAFFVREGATRRCLFRLDSPQPVRTVARVGEVAPLGIGAHGRALLAMEVARRPSLPIVSRGERLAEVMAIAVPVLDAQGRVAGSVGITLPLFRGDPATETRCVALVLREAIALTRSLGGDPAPLR